MLPRNFIATALLSTVLAAAPFGTALAGNYSHSGMGTVAKPGCTGGGVSVNKPVTIFKPVTINRNVNVYKPVTVNKDINIYKPVTINRNITVTKNIDVSKNININKTIIINKGGAEATASAEASAFAQALAQASANASASANNNLVIYAGGYNEYVTVNNRGGGGEISGIQTTGQCEMQQANVVKSVHALCELPDGRLLPASHMTADTWIDTSMEGEIMRCIPGAHLKIVVGDVMQTDQGMAGTYAAGQVLECGETEALRHYKDGMLKCAPKLPVKDCTERTNLRKYGTGDLFFSYRATVCVSTHTAARQQAHELDVTGMSLEGGVGGN